MDDIDKEGGVDSTTKIRILKQITTTGTEEIKKLEGVDSTTKIRILKQITTPIAAMLAVFWVLIPPQRYEF